VVDTQGLVRAIDCCSSGSAASDVSRLRQVAEHGDELIKHIG
jgi:hypothetical protein